MLIDVVFVVGGTTGVFDVEEVVDLLRDENAKDICVIVVPPELKYVNYMVIVTGRSTRHLRAMAAYIKWVVSYFYMHYAFDAVFPYVLVITCNTAYYL